MSATLKPLIEKVQKAWENRDQLKTELGDKAWRIAEDTKDNQLVTKYVRPFVSSEKAEQALQKLALIKNPLAEKVQHKLSDIRSQYLEVTAPREVPVEVVEKKTKRTKKSEDA